MTKKLRKTDGFRIKTPGTPISDHVFRKIEETYDSEDAFCNETDQEAPSCVQGHLIRTSQEVGGSCVICGRLLCASSAPS